MNEAQKGELMDTENKWKVGPALLFFSLLAHFVSFEDLTVCGLEPTVLNLE